MIESRSFEIHCRTAVQLVVIPMLVAWIAAWTSSPACAAAAAASQPEPVARRPGAIEGVVVDRDTRRALSGAVVLVEGTDRTAVSAGDGRFRIEDVAAGVVIVRAEATGYVPLTYPELQISPGRATTVVLELVPAPVVRDEVTVTGAAAARPTHVTTSSHSLVTEEVRRSAGSRGDVHRFVQALPGLAPVGDINNDLVVRGGSPGENLTLVDGIEVPNLNHLNAQGSTGGAASMLNNELLEGATFLAGAFPAQYGNRLSSVLDLRLREGNRTRPTLEADVNFAGAAVIAEGPVGKHGSWLASARRSYFDVLLDSERYPIPQLTSYTGKMVYDLNPRHKLTLLSLGGTDRILLNANNEEDLDEPSTLVQDLQGWRVVSGLTWQQLLGERAVGLLTVSDAIAKYDADVRDRQLDGGTVLRNASTEGETTIKYDLAWQTAGGWHLRGGASWKRLRRDLRFTQPLGVDQPWSADPERTSGVDLDLQSAAHIGSGYVEGSIRVQPRVTLTAGTRVDYFSLIDQLAIGPHAGVDVAITPRITVSAGVGRYHQQPEVLSIVAHPENARLEPMQADHLVLGLAYAPRPDLRITVEGYTKRYRRYPVSVEFPGLTLANHQVGFNESVSDLVLPLVSAGRGRARGLEVLLKQRLWKGLYGQVAYSLSRTEHAALDGIYRLGRYDAPHVTTIVGGYRLGSRWEFSGRFTIASGHPFTPPLMPESAEQNRWIYDTSRINGERLPAYHRLDLRADRRLSLWRRHVTLFVELQNAYNHKGAIEWTWNAKTRQPHASRQVRLLPILGVNAEF